LEAGYVQPDDRILLFNCATGLKYPLPDRSGRVDLQSAIDYAAL
jgi:threonine synthase